jgi:hypothetical protein
MKFQEFTFAHLAFVLFSAKLALLWVLTNYAFPVDPSGKPGETGKRGSNWWYWFATILARSLSLACIVTWVSGWSYILGLFTLGFAILLPLARRRIPFCYLAEFEIGANLLFILGASCLALMENTVPAVPAGSEPASRQAAAAYVVMAIVVFVIRGGANIVRGVLDKGGNIAELNESGEGSAHIGVKKSRQTPKYNRGRIIGMIERLMLMTFVAMQAYDALAFLLTAKGLFRARELDDAAFAEYFLVGTLTSSMVAIAAGLAIQFVLKLLW